VCAQAYFKSYDSSEFTDQKVAEFGNGDLLVGNSSITPLQTGNENGILKLIRIDFCGNHIWTKEFHYNQSYLLLKDIAVNQDDDVFLFGSSYKGLIESLFLMKIENGSPDVAEFRILNPGSVDHFSYSMDISFNEILIYGLLLDFNSSKEGFIGILDHNLNIKRTRKFVPFESTGNAIITIDGGVIARSGPYLYKFNQENQVDWAFTSKNQQDLQNISGPFKSDNGWIFESHNNGISFLFKVDTDGNLIWTTDQFEKLNIGGDLNQKSNDDNLFVYNKLDGTRTQLSFLVFNEQGQTTEEFFINHAFSMNTGTTRQREQNEYLNIIGSKNEFTTGVIDIENFILQFNVNDKVGECYSIDNMINASPNVIPINLEPLTITAFDFDLELIERLSLQSTPIVDRASDVCISKNDVVQIIETNMISCGETWSVNLPDQSYQWDDGHVNVSRNLINPGVYTARNIDCQKQEIIEYRLEKEDCGCEIYLPNVFSPNGDSTNETLELGAICDLESMELAIFDKWGGLIFLSHSIEKSWDGRINQNDAPSGTYAAMLSYTWFDKNGQLLENKITQAVSVIR